MTFPKDLIGKQEEVPANKKYMPSTRGNSLYKWQNAPGVVGAWEVHSEPDFDIHKPLTPLSGPGVTEELFEQAKHAWDRENLRDSLVAACDSIPYATACCGLVRDDVTTIKEAVPRLRKEWVPLANKKLASHGFSVSVFLWTWSNISGASDHVIMLIRFHQIL